MKRLALAVVAIMWLTGEAQADFAAGVRAYDAGDYETAYREWLPLARNNDAAAQRNIGHLYRYGKGVARDPVEAAKWYRRAAELGFHRAQANLASLYLKGEGVPQDYAEAAKWFFQAARQGHVIAQYNLGQMYERGLGVARDEARALAWYNLAARAGHKGALDRLSVLVLLGPAPVVADAGTGAKPTAEIGPLVAPPGPEETVPSGGATEPSRVASVTADELGRESERTAGARRVVNVVIATLPADGAETPTAAPAPGDGPAPQAARGRTPRENGGGTAAPPLKSVIVASLPPAPLLPSQPPAADRSADQGEEPTAPSSSPPPSTPPSTPPTAAPVPPAAGPEPAPTRPEIKVRVRNAVPAPDGEGKAGKEGAGKAAAVPAEEAPKPKKRGFFARLFGFGGDSDDKADDGSADAPAAQSPPPESAASRSDEAAAKEGGSEAPPPPPVVAALPGGPSQPSFDPRNERESAAAGPVPADRSEPAKAETGAEAIVRPADEAAPARAEGGKDEPRVASLPVREEDGEAPPAASGETGGEPGIEDEKAGIPDDGPAFFAPKVTIEWESVLGRTADKVAAAFEPAPTRPPEASPSSGASPSSEASPSPEIEKGEAGDEPRAAAANDRPSRLALAAGLTTIQRIEAGLTAYRARDYESAVAYWLPLAHAGRVRAQFYIGGMYHDGTGVPRDRVQALMWWTLAADKGYIPAQTARLRLLDQLSDEQVATARARARAWRPTE